MTHDELLFLADEPGLRGDLAQAVLAGDESAVYALYDLMTEEGDLSMDLQVGRPYLLRTIAHYYLGEIISCSFRQITMRRVTLVYDVGDIAKAYKSGKFEYVENYPPATVLTFNVGFIVVAEEWPHPLGG